MTKRKTLFPILLLSALSGFLTLSQEIVWTRLFAYTNRGSPVSFGEVLGLFLFGTALGSARISNRQLLKPSVPYREAILKDTTAGVMPTSRHSFMDCLRLTSLSLATAAVAYLFLPALAAMLYTRNSIVGGIFFYVSVVFIAFLNGMVFPLLSTTLAEGNRAPGFAISWVYLGNIVGSTLGPVFTGFYLFDHLTTDRIIFWFAAAGLVSAIGLGVWSRALTYLHTGVALVFAGAILFGTHRAQLYDSFYEKLGRQTDFSSLPHYNAVVENHSGVITQQPRREGDFVFGGGAYDGIFRIDPGADHNGVIRVFALAALHPSPRRVLMIGLATGSWAKALTYYRDLEHLTVVEINRGYLDLYPSHPEEAELLRDPRVDIVIDDGRRWLNRHPETRFDAIVSNVTFNDRAYVTNLLSKEYFLLLKRHLNPGGVVLINTTGSRHVSRTAAEVFSYVLSDYTMAASDSPFAMTEEERLQNLHRFDPPQVTRDGGASAQPEWNDFLAKAAHYWSLDSALALRADPLLRVITDDNLLTEFKAGHPWYEPKRKSWLSMFRDGDFYARAPR